MGATDASARLIGAPLKGYFTIGAGRSGDQARAGERRHRLRADGVRPEGSSCGVLHAPLLRPGRRAGVFAAGATSRGKRVGGRFGGQDRAESASQTSRIAGEHEHEIRTPRCGSSARGLPRRPLYPRASKYGRSFAAPALTSEARQRNPDLSNVESDSRDGTNRFSLESCWTK